MNRIIYRPTSTFRQVFLILLSILVILRYAINLEVKIHKLKYHDVINLPLTTILNSSYTSTTIQLVTKTGCCAEKRAFSFQKSDMF